MDEQELLPLLPLPDGGNPEGALLHVRLRGEDGRPYRGGNG